MAWLDPPWTWVSQNSPLPKHVFLQAGWGGCLVAITFWEAFATLPVYPCSKAAPQRGWDCNRCEVGRATRQGWLCWPSPRAGLLGYVFRFSPRKAAPPCWEVVDISRMHFWRAPSRDSRAGHGGSRGPVVLSPHSWSAWGSAVRGVYASQPCLCGHDSAQARFRRFPWKHSSRHEEGAFLRQLWAWQW